MLPRHVNRFDSHFNPCPHVTDKMGDGFSNLITSMPSHPFPENFVQIKLEVETLTSTKMSE